MALDFKINGETGTRVLLVAALCAALVPIGCGGDVADAAGCSGVTACGGDLTGTWKVELECASVQPSSPILDSGGMSLPAECRSAIPQAFDAAHYDTTGLTISFSGTEMRESGSVTMTFPLTFTGACFRALGAPAADAAACNQLGSSLMQSGQMSSGCTPASGGCTCTMSVTQSVDVTGTYEIRGNQLITNNGMVANDYCVKGDTASLYEMGLGITGRMRLTRAANAPP